MLLIHSPKGIWRNHRPEWLEYHPDQIKPASKESAVKSVDTYIERVELMLKDVKVLQEEWRRKQGRVYEN